MLVPFLVEFDAVFFLAEFREVGRPDSIEHRMDERVVLVRHRKLTLRNKPS